jgi:biopolymer transport protein ExbD
MANKYRVKRNKNTTNTVSEINVVPYIDVMLVLLVIFMVTAPMMYQQVDVVLPSTTSSDDSSISENFIAVDIIANDTYNVNYSGKLEQSISALPFEKIAVYMKEKQLNQVFIRSDENIEYGHLISIMDDFKKNGINNIGLITEKRNDQ